VDEHRSSRDGGWARADARFPGGPIAIAYQPQGPRASDATAAEKGREIAAALGRAGFSEVRVETLALKPAVVCVLGVNGAVAA
jgi:hypothetical protein